MKKTTTIYIYVLLVLAAGVLLGLYGTRWMEHRGWRLAKLFVPRPPVRESSLEDALNCPRRPPEFSPATFTKRTIDVKNSAWRLVALDSSILKFSDLAGKVVFINSWTTGCLQCIAEMPSIEALYDSLKNEQVAFVVYSPEPVYVVRPFVIRKGWKLPIYSIEPQTYGSFPPELQVSARPTTHILDREGKIVYQEARSCIWNDSSAIKFIRGLESSVAAQPRQ